MRIPLLHFVKVSPGAYSIQASGETIGTIERGYLPAIRRVRKGQTIWEIDTEDKRLAGKVYYDTLKGAKYGLSQRWSDWHGKMADHEWSVAMNRALEREDYEREFGVK